MEFKRQLKKVKKSLEYHRIHRGIKVEETFNSKEPRCLCKDKKGEYKRLYPTQEDAVAQAHKIWQSLGVKLSSYPCPTTLGWHLYRS
jgi:hypothetical protein